MSSNVSNKNENNWIPDGFLIVKGPDDEKYLVPEFMVQALDQDFYSKKKKEELNAFKLSGTVCIILLKVLNSHAGAGISRHRRLPIAGIFLTTGIFITTERYSKTSVKIMKH